MRNKISLSLPIRKEPYDDKSCKAFFAGLLPEGEHARKEIAAQFGVNTNSRSKGYYLAAIFGQGKSFFTSQ